MSFIVKAIKSRQYILVEHEDELTREEFEEARAIAKIKLDQHHWNRVLVDVRYTVNRVAEEDVHYIVESIARLLPSVKFSVVLPPERELEGKFLERVAANRKLDLKSFVDYDAALAWLTKKSA